MQCEKSEQYCKECMHNVFSRTLYWLHWRDLAEGCKRREEVCVYACVCLEVGVVGSRKTWEQGMRFLN